MSWHITRQFSESSELRNNKAWASPSERLHRPIPLWVEQIGSNESQGYPSTKRWFTHSSSAWPYEAMERGLAWPVVRTIKTRGWERKNKWG